MMILTCISHYNLIGKIFCFGNNKRYSLARFCIILFFDKLCGEIFLKILYKWDRFTLNVFAELSHCTQF